jgi:hypothetical protein
VLPELVEPARARQRVRFGQRFFNQLSAHGSDDRQRYPERVDRTAATPALSDLFTAYLTSGRAPRASAELARPWPAPATARRPGSYPAPARATVDLPGSVWHGRRLLAK